MNSWTKPVLLLMSFAFFAVALELGITTYDQYQVVEVGGIQVLQNEDEFFTSLGLPLDQDLEVLHEDLSIGTVQVLVNPGLRTDFRNKVTDYGLTHEVLIDNVGQLIESSNNLRSEGQALDGEIRFDRYMTFQEIEKSLRETGKKIPTKVRVTTIGHSYEGENITMVTISDSINKSKKKAKPIIFVEAGAHPREWISIASAMYLIFKLSKYTRLTRNVEWRIVPVLNPDGYKYTWTTSRLWRKNRRQEENTYCKGVDLNRNFDSYWNQAGASSRRCSSVYAGKSAFSEPETRAIRDAVREVKHRVKAYISIHSYGQLLMYPPGGSFHTLSKKSFATVNRIAKKMSDAILRATNTGYKIGSPKTLLYSASGISMDWAMLTEKIPLAFTFEMRDKGKNGFLLPNSEIQSAVNDIWSAMNVLHNTVTNKKSNLFSKIPLLKISLHTNATAQGNLEINPDAKNDLNSTTNRVDGDVSQGANISNILMSQTEEIEFPEDLKQIFFEQVDFSSDSILAYYDERTKLNESSSNYPTDSPFNSHIPNQIFEHADYINSSSFAYDNETAELKESSSYQTYDPFNADIENQVFEHLEGDYFSNLTEFSQYDDNGSILVYQDETTELSESLSNFQTDSPLNSLVYNEIFENSETDVSNSTEFSQHDNVTSSSQNISCQDLLSELSLNTDIPADQILCADSSSSNYSQVIDLEEVNNAEKVNVGEENLQSNELSTIASTSYVTENAIQMQDELLV